MKEHKKEAGFSYVDVLCGIIILMIGILALVGAITAALVRSTELDQQLQAKQIATSTLESVISARDINRPGGIPGWDSIQNAPAGLFLIGFSQLQALAQGRYDKIFHKKIQTGKSIRHQDGPFL